MNTREFSAMLFVVAISTAPSAARAESFQKSCPDIASCAKAVARLTGQKYVIAPDVKGQVTATDNLTLTRDNAELLFTTLLHQNGYTRVPLKAEDTYQILRLRDARDTAIPVLEATSRNKPRFPAVWDMAELRYKADNPEVVEQMARALRSFLPANARIIPMELNGTVLVSAAIPELEKCYGHLAAMDVKPSKELLERWRRDEEDRRKRDFMPPPEGARQGQGQGFGTGPVQEPPRKGGGRGIRPGDGE